MHKNKELERLTEPSEVKTALDVQLGSELIMGNAAPFSSLRLPQFLSKIAVKFL